MWLKEAKEIFRDEHFGAKTNELVANQFRHKDKSGKIFLDGMQQVMVRSRRIRSQSSHNICFKQESVKTVYHPQGGQLFGGNYRGRVIVRTWPVRKELYKRTKNVLASSVVLVCRKQVTMRNNSCEFLGRNREYRSLPRFNQRMFTSRYASIVHWSWYWYFFAISSVLEQTTKNKRTAALRLMLRSMNF